MSDLYREQAAGAPEADAGLTVVTEARSLLFVPGDRPDRFAKAAAAAADLVICDSEDAVGAGSKDGARAEVVAWLAGQGRATVRINTIDSPAHEADVAALARMTSAGPHGLFAVMVP